MLNEHRPEFDLVIRHGHVLTMNAARATFPDGLLGIKDGRITAIEDDRGRLHYRTAHEIDATGCAVLPGMINAHTHLAMTLFRGMADDVALEEFVSRLTTEEANVLTPDTVGQGAASAAAESILAGTTAALDMYWFSDATVAAAADYGLQVVSGPTFATFAHPDPRSFTETLRDAEEQLARFPVGDPAAPALMPHSTYALTRKQLEEVAGLAQRHACRIHVHAGESKREVAQVRRLHGATPIQVLAQTGLLGPKTVIAHAVEVDDDDIETLAATRTSVAHCPWSNLKLACGVAPVGKLLKAGVTVALGTDGAVSSNGLDLWSAAKLAATLHKGVSGDPALITAEQAIAMATVNGARALGLAGEIGTLEVGRRATLQVVDLSRPHFAGCRDVWSALTYSARPSDVRDVIVDGVQRVSSGALIGK
ncbi:amidohydrolase family protein [Nonomuraea sp. CA-143628]|uniref:amidohydrolase family protein n=1 Tax=Nonomuraea sp. CA-143628 TaxID=3239997 RepID=UPI003D92B47F